VHDTFSRPWLFHSIHECHMFSRPYLFHLIPPATVASLWPPSHSAPPGPLLLVALVHTDVRRLQLQGAPPRAPHGLATLSGPPPAGSTPSVWRRRSAVRIEERSDNGELGPHRPRGGEDWEWHPRACCRAPTTSTWSIRASSSPQAPNYNFVSIDLTGRPCLSTYPCSASG
jgi:hypothetical protein